MIYLQLMCFFVKSVHSLFKESDVTQDTDDWFSRLADKLKSHTLYSKGDGRYFGKSKRSRKMSTQLLSCVFDTLYKCFLYDSLMALYLPRGSKHSCNQSLTDQMKMKKLRNAARLS
ncbi:uncharacterized protein LOC124277363 isoform X2 [Haliotis rubra]|uniref:uncharacterized protein LOC124277363 isoform X2 n=1 Tax=Haliotis rubra TaxID=36100 RepID=UPI001EE56A3D|nr:uncharacterized protein LOC124277363 isoform X2 [Haliotis rubra]